MNSDIETKFQIPSQTDDLIRWSDAGQIMAVFCQDLRYNSLLGKDLYLKILPALTLGQYVLARKTVNQPEFAKPIKAPLGVILWAKVSDELHNRFMGLKEIPYLLPQEWNSGENYWIIDTPGDQKVIGGLLEQLHREQFQKQPFHAFMHKGSEGINVQSFGANH